MALMAATETSSSHLECSRGLSSEGTLSEIVIKIKTAERNGVASAVLNGSKWGLDAFPWNAETHQ